MAAGLYLRQLHYQQLFYLYGAISLVLGVYLTDSGFKSRGSESRVDTRTGSGTLLE